jgi:hypothetical protein
MASTSPENDPAYFGFTDLHGFKDFVGGMALVLPDAFMHDDWLAPEDQMNLDRAFVGLRYGLDLAAKEKGESALLARCRTLVEESYAEYKAGRDHAGQLKLEEVEKLLAKLPTE